MRKKNFMLLICLVMLIGILAAACNSGGDSNGSASLDGKTILEDRCVECHSLSRVKSASKTREEWGRTINRMISFGAELTSNEQEVLLDYLEATYP